MLRRIDLQKTDDGAAQVDDVDLRDSADREQRSAVANPRRTRR